MRRPVPGKLIGRHSLSKVPKGREHILAVSWNLHKYLLQWGVQWGSGDTLVSGHKAGQGRVGSVSGNK